MGGNVGRFRIPPESADPTESAFYSPFFLMMLMPDECPQERLKLNTMTDLTSFEIALARSRMYEWLGRAFLHGMSTELLPYAVDIPELAAVLPEPFEHDAAAAEYQALFGFNIFPYQSIFLDTTGLLGGNETVRVQGSYDRSGFSLEKRDVSPDHVGYELTFLAFLCGAEADAWEDDLPEIAERMQRRQSDFVQSHLLRWIAPFTAAILRQGSPFYTALAELTQAMIADHASTILPTTVAGSPFTLPASADLAANEQTGLREIVDYLLAPTVSGFFLARADIERLGRRFDLPRGFGERRQLLLNLLRAAGAYGQFPALCGEMAALAAADEQTYSQLERDFPTLSPYVRPWIDRTKKSTVQIARLGQEAHSNL